MKLKKYLLLFTLCLTLNILSGWSQSNRLVPLKTQLESLVIDVPGLSAKADINVNNIALSDFLQAVATTHKINLNLSPELSQIVIKNNFSNVTVIDILLFVCKEFTLTIDFTGTILSVRKYSSPTPIKRQRIIPITYIVNDDLLSIDLQRDSLYVVVKQLIDKTGKNLVFAPGMENLLLTAYIKNMPFDTAIDKLAFSNNIVITKTRDNYYLMERSDDFTALASNQNTASNTKQQRAQRPRRSNFFFEVTNDTYPFLLTVDFENIPVSSFIYDIGHELKQNMFTSTPLNDAGNASVKAEGISFELLLEKVLENTDFTFKKQDSIYFFGKKDQVSLRDAVVIPLLYRSIEVMTSREGSDRKLGKTNYTTPTNFSGNQNTAFDNNTNTNRQNLNTGKSNLFADRANPLESLISMLPDDVVKDLKVSVDLELNSFIVSGPSQNINRFKKFVSYIDKPVPVILIEVMVMEINKSSTVETGVSAGIGTEPTVTQGAIYPATDLNLGATTINRIIGGFNGFGSLNLGQVVPNFYAKIKAMETNGDIKIRSAPKLSALNGHRANLSIGETTYYAVTQRDIIGTQNPQTSTITNYYPIDAEFAITIKPMVSGDGHITLDINVVQSNFNGKKIAADAPPGINSREFNSIIRVKDQDLIILGGLEEKMVNDTGTGVPFLARVPLIKWLFSNKKREDNNKKLTVLIKPTIIK